MKNQFLLFIFLSCSGLLISEFVFAQHGEERINIYQIASVITIDGKLDEATWKETLWTPVFGDIVTGKAPLYAAKAKMLWDDQNLYIAFVVEDPNIWAFKTIRDDPMAGHNPGCIIGHKPNEQFQGGWGPFKENFIKIYIDPDGDGRNYIEMHVNPLGKICDKWQVAPWSQSTRDRLGIPGKGSWLHPADPHPEWNCPGLQVGVHTEGSINDPYDVDDCWTVELAIPFSSIEAVTRHGKADLAFPPRAGDTWRMHLGRRYRASHDAPDVQYWTWPTIGIPSCHEPDRAG
ncbi:hypothetical protein ES708_16760 [subsurface metagenome]